MALLNNTLITGKLQVTEDTVISNTLAVESTISEAGTLLSNKYVRHDISNQGLTDTQKSNARTNIGAGTSNFTGYTTSNKLSTNCINNEAGWTANVGTITKVTTIAGTHSAIDVSSGNVTFNVPTKTSHLTNDSGFVTSSGVTSVATSGTGLSGGTITSTGTITLDSSSAGNAVANKVVLRNATGSIQSEKIAISSGTTTKVNMQYNSTEDCVEFIFA